MQMPVPDPAILSRRSAIVARLRTVIGAGDVIDDPVEARAYECDALSAYRCAPLAVALPTTTEEVAAILRVCHEDRVPVVPRGAVRSFSAAALRISLMSFSRSASAFGSPLVLGASGVSNFI